MLSECCSRLASAEKHRNGSGIKSYGIDYSPVYTFPVNRLVTSALCFHIFFAGWTGAFRVHPLFPLHVISLLIAIGLHFQFSYQKQSIPKKIFCFEDVFIFLGLLTIFVSGVVLLNAKTITYLLAYFYVFLANYMFLKVLLFKYIKMQTFFIVNVFAVLVMSSFVLFEFVSAVFFNFDVQRIIPRETRANATYLLFHRAYGFSVEPTNLAFYLNCLAPLAVWRILRSLNRLKYLLVITICFAWFVTFSAAGYAFLFFSITIVFSVKTLKKTNLRVKFTKENIFKPIILLLLGILLICFFIMGKQELSNFFSPILTKLTLSNKDLDGSRFGRWEEAVSLIIEDPFLGKGIGYLSARGRGSSVSWYLSLAVDSGVFATCFFAIFLMITFYRIVQSQFRGKYWLLTGFVASILHYNVVSLFQDPSLWLLISVFYVVRVSPQNLEPLRG